MAAPPAPWYPQGDLNPCYQDENLASWTWLDDGDLWGENIYRESRANATRGNRFSVIPTTSGRRGTEDQGISNPSSTMSTGIEFQTP